MEDRQSWKNAGLPTVLRQTFVSQDSPYFRIDVEFEPVTRADGRLGFLPEDNRDVILRVSKPYVQFAPWGNRKLDSSMSGNAITQELAGRSVLLRLTIL
jgi:hypothetical protein